MVSSRILIVATVAAMATWSVGCRVFGMPQVALQAGSPDGQFVASVRNHASIDPPNQSLWITARDGRENLITKLAEDQDWCDRIVWSPDSKAVLFVVTGLRLVIVRPDGPKVILDKPAGEAKGYPPSALVKEARFLPNGDLAISVCNRVSPSSSTVDPKSCVSQVLHVEFEAQ